MRIVRNNRCCGHLARNITAVATKVRVENAVVVTGANGTGKTTLLDSVALSAGLDPRYSTSRTQSEKGSETPSRLEHRNAIRGLRLAENRGTAALDFDLVLRYRGTRMGALPTSINSEESVLPSMAPQERSHGEIAATWFGITLKRSSEFLEGRKGRLLLLLDELEVGFAVDSLLHVAARCGELCARARSESTERASLRVIVATQSPIIALTCLEAGASRLDLGWPGGVDPFPPLIEALKAPVFELMNGSWTA